MEPDRLVVIEPIPGSLVKRSAHVKLDSLRCYRWPEQAVVSTSKEMSASLIPPGLGLRDESPVWGVGLKVQGFHGGR